MDPHYDAISKALSGQVDPLRFEECVVDLLRRDAFPTLVWIRGGTDGGVDGATAADGPFMVGTTSRGVYGNLTKSLKSYLKSGGQRRAVVVACTDELTARRRSNLGKAAAALGFRVLQIYERANVARLLYRDSAWTQALLGLTGTPSALSILSPGTRPVLNEDLVGRDEDVEWLRETEGDRLLAGAPGIGKTFVLAELAKQGWGLFMLDSDPSRLASAIRDQSPSVVVVDDPLATRDRIRALMSLRAQLSATFSIVVAAWEENVPAVAGILSLEESRVRVLQPLDRDQMVDVVKGAGVHGPDRLVSEIVSQAAGRPGLAATLCRLCIRGDVRSVVLGNALRNNLSAVLGEGMDSRAVLVLGALALGGNSGMDRESLCQILGLAPAELSMVLSEVAPSGVIRPAPERRLSIWPRALRYALIRDVFFLGLGDPSLEALLGAVPDRGECAKSLVGATASDAAVPMLLDVLKAAESPEAWSYYASLGKEEATWVIGNRPGMLEKTSEATMIHAPELSIRALIVAPVEPESGWPFGQEPWAAQRIEEWISGGDPETEEAVRRRRLGVRVAADEVRKGNGNIIAQRTLAAAMSPGFQRVRSDPGRGRTGTYAWGVLPSVQLQEICHLWDEVASVLGDLTSIDWPMWFNVVGSWTHPGLGGPGLSDNAVTLAQDLARRIIGDLASLAADRPGVMQELRKRGRTLGCDLDETVDEEYETLFPEEPHGYSQASLAVLWESASELGRRWSSEPPSEVASRMAQMEERATEAGKNWPRLTPHASAAIVESSESPEEWLGAFVEADAPPDVVAPFVRGILGSDRKLNTRHVVDLLSSDKYRLTTAFAIMTADRVSDDVLQAALASLEEGDAGSVEMVVLGGDVRASTVERLLRHGVPGIASAAATGLWMSDPKGAIPYELRDAWRKAIVKTSSDAMILDDILAADASLAFDWIRDVIRTGRRLGRHDEAPRGATAALSSEQRQRLVTELRQEYRHLHLAVLLVGDDLDAYRKLLQRKDVESLHLHPLGGDLTDGWKQKAVLAMEAGYTARDVATAATTLPMISWSGSEAEMWDGWVERFTGLGGDSDPRVRSISEEGIAVCQGRKATAEQREQVEAVFGR